MFGIRHRSSTLNLLSCGFAGRLIISRSWLVFDPGAAATSVEYEKVRYSAEGMDAEEEPTAKRAKVDEPKVESDAKGNEVGSASQEENVKKYFLSDKDGNRHPTLGRDDFIPLSKEIFEPLIGEIRLYFSCRKWYVLLNLTIVWYCRILWSFIQQL